MSSRAGRLEGIEASGRQLNPTGYPGLETRSPAWEQRPWVSSDRLSPTTGDLLPQQAFHGGCMGVEWLGDGGWQGESEG